MNEKRSLFHVPYVAAAAIRRHSIMALKLVSLTVDDDGNRPKSRALYTLQTFLYSDRTIETRMTGQILITFRPVTVRCVELLMTLKQQLRCLDRGKTCRAG